MALSPAARVLLDHAPPEYEALWANIADWRFQAHGYQIPPEREWRGWLMLGGRGIGKTLTGARDVVEYALTHPNSRYGIVAPTLGDARDICVEGETGVLAVARRMGVEPDWNRSLLELNFANGAHVKCYGSEKPDRLRGPQHHRLWFEEVASLKDAHKGDVLNTTFNNAMLGLRLGTDARYVATTTPRRVQLIVDLLARDGVVVSRGTTYDNLANLAPTFREEILRYEGTTIGRQELLGELITEDPGALWRWHMVEDHRLDTVPDMASLAVGVDPSGGVAEVGIVTAGEVLSPCPCGREREAVHFAVVDDRSGHYSPEGWASAAASAYHEYSADVIVPERNFGRDMVISTLRNHDPDLPVRPVDASRGKAVRAEPVVLLYEQGRVHHVGAFPALESELTTWVPNDSSWSPNRLDALVWALTYTNTGTPVERTVRVAQGRITRG